MSGVYFYVRPAGVMRIMDGKKRLGVLCESGLCSSSPSPSPNRRHRSVDKRVVSVPIVNTEAPPRAKGAGETTPPADSWAWRKYGQKPIKGSPYPRGYYRCSSSKGCPARKQVERSRVDPTMLVVTYSGNHIHSPNTDTDTKTAYVAKGGAADLDPDPTIHQSPQHEFPDLIADDPDLMAMPNDFWFSGPGSTFSTTTTTWAELTLEDCAKSGGDDELFDGLGELPEYSVAYRRNYLERQMAAG